jgi:hypothetical protein
MSLRTYHRYGEARLARRHPPPALTSFLDLDRPRRRSAVTAGSLAALAALACASARGVLDEHE